MGDASDALLSEPLRNRLSRKKMAGVDMPAIDVFVEVVVVLFMPRLFLAPTSTEPRSRCLPSLDLRQKENT